MTEEAFVFALARVTASQTLRKAGFDRTSPSIVDSFTDLLRRSIQNLGQGAQNFALIERRKSIDIRDVRMTLEQFGFAPVTEDEQGIMEFLDWFETEDFAEFNKIAGRKNQETKTWVEGLMQQQMRQSTDDMFDNTILKRGNDGDSNGDEQDQPVFGSEATTADINQAFE